MDITVLLWSESAFLPILTLMTLVPLAAMLGVLLVDSTKLNRIIGFLGGSLTAVLAAYLIYVYDADNTGIQLAEHLSFAGLNYSVGVDGANILFLPLVTIITLLSLLYVQGTRYANDGQLIAAILGYETILIGAFSALNALQFWLWCVVEVFPVAFLTLYTGTGQQRKQALTVLLQFWGSGLLLSFIGFMLLGFGIEDPEQALNFDWLTLAQNNAPFMNETLIFILLFYGFAVRMPLFPFHAWLPFLAEQGSVVVSVVFIVGLKLGIYAFIRFILPLVPGVAEEWSALVVVMGLFSIFYGATLALMQINIRRLLAFAVISQTGMLIIGSITFESTGVEGGILLSLIFGLSAAGLFYSIGFVFERTRTAAIPRLGGLFDSNTAVGLLFLIATVSMIAMPGTPGFNPGHMLIDGVVKKNGWIIAVVIGLGNFLAAGFLLWAFQRIFLMDPRHAIYLAKPHKSLNHEKLITLIICGLLIVAGYAGSALQGIVDTATGTIGKYYSIHNSIYEEDNERTYEIDNGNQENETFPDSNNGADDSEPLPPDEELNPDFDINKRVTPEETPGSGKAEPKPALMSIEDV